MTEKIFEEIDKVASSLTGISKNAMDYCLFQKRIMSRARDGSSGYRKEAWLGLRDFVTDDFERMGTFKEVMNFDAMIRLQQGWSPATNWYGSFERISELDNVVVLELGERVVHEGEASALNSISVFEYAPNGKLQHLDVYMQSPPISSFPTSESDAQ